MKKSLKWLLIGIIIIVVIFFIVKESLKEEAILTFPDTVLVENATNKNVDKIVKAIVFNVLKYDTIHIGVVYIPKQLENIGNIKIRAFIQKNQFKDNYYLIFLAKDLKTSEYKMVLSHEMAHLEQYQKGDLRQIKLGLEKIIYKGDTIDYYETSYKERAHEIDAFAKQGKIYKQLNDVLYK